MTPSKNPVALACADRALNTDLAGWQIGTEHTSPRFDVQEFRAAWIMRRARLSRQTARVVAVLYFGETAQ
jgi:hypothetical protein